MSGYRKLIGLIASSVLASVMTACANGLSAPSESSPAPMTAVRIASLKGPTTMGLVHLMSEAAAGRATWPYQVTMHGTPDEVVPGLVKGDIDIALLPANLAAVLYNRTHGEVQVAAVNTLGVLYVVEAGDSVHKMADLVGRTVISTGKGASPQYVLDFLLKQNGLDPSRDVTVEYRSESTEVVALLATKDKAVAVLPEPFVTVAASQNPRLRVALDLTREWEAVSPESSLITGVLVVRKSFAAERRAAVAGFLSDYQESTRFTNEHPAEAGALIAGYGIVPNASLAEKAIPSCNITFVDGEAMQHKVKGYLEVLFAANPASIGGAMPGDDFYYQP